MIHRWYVPIVFLTLLAGAGFLVGPRGAWLAPSLAAAATVVTARRCLRAHHLGIAVAAGLAEGLWFHGRFLVPAILLLVLGGVVRIVRRVVPLPTPLHLLVVAIVVGFLYRLGVTIFPATRPGSTLGVEALPWAVGGALATGLVAVAMDRWVVSWSPLRHQFDRP